MPGKRKRPFIVSLPLFEQEKKELQEAADAVALPVSVFVRSLALTEIRRRRVEQQRA